LKAGISAPCLSFTLKNSCTTLTFTLNVSIDWSWSLALFCARLDASPIPSRDSVSATTFPLANLLVLLISGFFLTFSRACITLLLGLDAPRGPIWASHHGEFDY